MFDFTHFVFDTPLNLVYGLLTGLVFGFLLQKASVTRFRTIVGQFLLVDHTVLRTMVTAVVVGSIGVWALVQFGGVATHIKGATLLANIVGGVIFGVGMALLGYCPGTGVAALGDGSRHAIFGVLGMMAGAAAYAEVYSPVKANILNRWVVTAQRAGEATDNITLADISPLNIWVYIVVMAVIAAALMWWLRGKDKVDLSGQAR